MAKRYTDIRPVTRCYNPITVYHHGEGFVVPCGKCSACLLDKSNNWSMRVCNEIESTPYSIFFTLTYNNKYLPKAKIVPLPKVGYLIANHEENIRFNGTEDVQREPFAEFVSGSDLSKDLSIQNFEDGYFSYADKRDIILWLKLLKKDIYERFGRYGAFRHFIISEYGPTTYRNHLHGLLFCEDGEIADYLLRISMYKNWKMCDKALFDKYTHYCDAGAAQYVTQYLTCNSNLPSVLAEGQFKPFRLASKAPAIGYKEFDSEKIFESIFGNTIEYCRDIRRIEQRPLLVYPSAFVGRLLPKCFEFSLLDFDGLLYRYGLLFRLTQYRKWSFDEICDGLRTSLRTVDYTCTRKCYDFCLKYNTVPFVYVHLLDHYYYLVAMQGLRKFYQWQEQCKDAVDIAFAYTNFEYYIKNYRFLKSYGKFVIDTFCANLGFDASEFVDKIHNDSISLVYNNNETDKFRLEVEDILIGMVKMPKFNEKFGFSPHIV